MFSKQEKKIIFIIGMVTIITLFLCAGILCIL